MESAKRFKCWVTSEILPSIRKHGIYATDNVIDNILNNPDFGIQLLTKLKEERTARVEAERRNAILMHVNKTYTVTEIAKELGLKSAIQLNKILAEKKIQYQVNGTWVMYSKYSDLGYEEIKQEVLDSGRVIYHRRPLFSMVSAIYGVLILLKTQTSMHDQEFFLKKQFFV